MAAWIMGYGLIQVLAPKFTGSIDKTSPSAKLANWGLLLAIIPTLIAVGLSNDLNPHVTLIVGITVFGILFAINSALHSYLIVEMAREDGVSLDVGFYIWLTQAAD